MSLDSSIVGQSGTPQVHLADARWTMAYAAALGDTAPRYFDTRLGVSAHPLFPVCLEWPAIVESRQLMAAAGLEDAEQRRMVHAAQDLLIERPIAAGETLTTLATFVGVEQKRPGTFCTTRLDTHDAGGALVCRSYHLGLLRGVGLHRETRWLEQPPPAPAAFQPGAAGGTIPIAVPFNAAHVYTECARIWNPIHTDRKAALEAGLPELILHGTMTLALAVSKLVASRLDGDGGRVRRVGARFAAMVPMPAQLKLEFAVCSARLLAFRVLTESGGEAIRDGFMLLRN